MKISPKNWQRRAEPARRAGVEGRGVFAVSTLGHALSHYYVKLAVEVGISNWMRRNFAEVVLRVKVNGLGVGGVNVQKKNVTAIVRIAGSNRCFAYKVPYYARSIT